MAGLPGYDALARRRHRQLALAEIEAAAKQALADLDLLRTNVQVILAEVGEAQKAEGRRER